MFLVCRDLGRVYVLQTVHVERLVQVVVLNYFLFGNHQPAVIAHDDDVVSDDKHFDAINVALDQVGFVADAETDQSLI